MTPHQITSVGLSITAGIGMLSHLICISSASIVALGSLKIVLGEWAKKNEAEASEEDDDDGGDDDDVDDGVDPDNDDEPELPDLDYDDDGKADPTPDDDGPEGPRIVKRRSLRLI